MADAPLKIFCNTSAPNTENALVKSFTDATAADALIFTVTDSAKAIELHFETEDPSGFNPGFPFIETDPSVAPITAQIAAGKINQPVTGGSWRFLDTVGAVGSGYITYNATAASVQTIIRAGCVTNFGSCIVTGNAGGPWVVDRGVTGALGGAPTGDTSATSPANSVLQVIPVQTGTTYLDDQWEITLLQPPAVLATLSGSYLPAAFVTPLSVVTGSPGISALQSLTWNSDAYSGSVAISATIPTGIQITSASVANPSIITTPAHGLTVGQVYTVVITGNTTTGVNATWQATVASATTFSIPYNNTTGGTGGTFAITAPLSPVAYNAAPADIQTAFESHPSALSFSANISVTQSGPGAYGITFGGALAGLPIATITATQTLKVPVGLAGTLNTNTAGVIQILANSGSTGDVTVDLQINKTEGGITRTIAFRDDCVLRPSLIPIGAVLSNPLSGVVTVISATSVLSSPTAAAFKTANSFASSGANSDITSLTGLTTALSGAQGGTGVANTGHTITLGGNLTTSGAFAFTATLTAATNVTFPTTGTLSTLAGSETLSNKTLVAPALGAATATTINGTAIPTSSTLQTTTGSGAGLTALNASNISSGKLSTAFGGTGGTSFSSLSVQGPSSTNTIAISSSTYTKVTGWDTPEWDTDSAWSGANSRYTPILNGRTGPLHFLVHAVIYSDAGAYTWQIWLYKNGSKYKILGGANNSSPTGGSCVAVANGSTDYFEIFVFQNSGGSENVYNGVQITSLSFTLIPTN